MQEDIDKKDSYGFASSENKKKAFYLRETQSDDDEEDEDEIIDEIHKEQLNADKNLFQIKPSIENNQEVQHEDITKSHQNLKILRKTEASEKSKKIKKLGIRKQTKRWTLEENKLYLNFLQSHAHLFQYKTVRRIRQVFIMLSEKMGGKRTPSQCKSHHQKMKNATKKGTMKEIIAYIKEKNLSYAPKIKSRFQNYISSEGLRVSYGWKTNNYEIRVKLETGCTEKW